MADLLPKDSVNLRKLVTLTPELGWRVDEFRWGNRIGSESEALRRIIKAGLDALNVRLPPNEEEKDHG